MTSTPIADYALLSDRHSAALVAKDGSVDWLCFPRFDSPSVFGAILDLDAGYWWIRPSVTHTVSRRYLDQTMVLESTFETAEGTLTVTDALAVRSDGDPHRLGVDAPHALVRAVRCVRGTVDTEVFYQPRPEYGLVVPLLSAGPGGLLTRGGSEMLALSTPVELTTCVGGAEARVRLTEGDDIFFALHRSALGEPSPQLCDQDEIAKMLDGTVAAWRSWSELHQAYEGPWREQVHHSGRVLQALSYQPTSAIVAAPTTSLPEGIGGTRNWDYRYAWVRDASLTMEALWVAACPDEAIDFFRFMMTAAASYRPRDTLQIMFGVGGEHDLSERELLHLDGWRDSRPVRVGNNAWTQKQIDVYGELLGAAHRLADELTDIDDDLRKFLGALADTAVRLWPERDNGIWEIRGEPRHFLYSKLMCWVALDRVIALADRLAATARVPVWARVRDEIRETILRDGWNEEAQAYTQSFGSTELDASVLMMPITGFVPADDPRMLATIDAIAERLTDDRGLVYRYRTAGGVDGIPGDEGTFLLCTFWLAHAQALAGHLDEARATFERAAGYANDVGLLAEEVDPRTGALLGNFPQAFSHIGLVNTAWAIACAEKAGSATT